jgi:precorrin-8X/cobalt-precorrin-8 methylmutase
VLRVIHATGDFDFKSGLHIHPDAVREGIKAIREGMDIVSDVEMVRAGINKRLLSKWGGRAICGISDADVGGTKTRAEAGIGAAVSANTGIIAIGNAPSALMSAINSILEGKFRPKLLIGVPVGFVKAVEAKTFLSVQSFPFITNHGRKGGSAACAAIVNALLRMADEVEEREG